MASPNYDTLSVQHSRYIGDAVSSASTNGASISSVQRDTHLNNAIRRFLRIKYLMKDYDCINQYVIESSATAMTGNLLSLTSLTPTVAWIIDVVNTTATNLFVRPISQNLVMYAGVANSTNSFIQASATNQYWTRQGVSVRVLGAGATDSIKVRYVAQHTALTASFATDILIDSQYFDIISELALQEYCSDYPSEENIIRMKSSIERAKMLLGNN